MPGHVAFVPLRYGPQIVGGSEAVTREMARGLSARGWDVEVLTTRVIDHYSWADELPEGVSQEDGVTVRRFSTLHHWSRCALRAQQAIERGVVPPLDDQWSWVSWRFSVPDLFHHLLRHSGGYDSVIFSPYLFWNTIVCLPAARSNSVVMPCLHDETYARLDVVRPVLAEPRSVWFLSEPEHRLAHTLGPVSPRHAVVGAGVDVPQTYDPDGFRKRHGLRRPFLLYVGRRERDKGWDWLVSMFSSARFDAVDLVTIGSGKVDPVPGVIDLGFVSEQERNDAFSAALAYVQPSKMESFSRTIMEAWLAGTPVLAVDGGAVVAWHIERSSGGHTFSSADQLSSLVRRLLGDPAEARRLAEAGRRYVLDEYSWPVVLDRVEAELQASGPS